MRSAHAVKSALRCTIHGVHPSLLPATWLVIEINFDETFTPITRALRGARRSLWCLSTESERRRLRSVDGRDRNPVGRAETRLSDFEPGTCRAAILNQVNLERGRGRPTLSLDTAAGKELDRRGAEQSLISQVLACAK